MNTYIKRYRELISLFEYHLLLSNCIHKANQYCKKKCPPSYNFLFALSFFLWIVLYASRDVASQELMKAIAYNN